MKKQAAIIGSVLVAVCLFISAPVYAAQLYPQKTFSVAANNSVGAYATMEFRGLIVEQEYLTSNSGSTYSDKSYVVIHVDFTMRNATTKMAVADSNNLRLTVTNFYAGSPIE